MLDEKTRRALNGANSKMVSAITGRTAHEEAKEGKTYDIVAGVRATRLRWLGKILQMGEDRMLLRAAKTMYENPQEGDLLMDAPATSSWTELRKLAKEQKEWAQAVRAIKDTINIKKRGKRNEREEARPQKCKKKKTKDKRGDMSKDTGASTKGKKRAAGKEEDDDDNDEDEGKGGGWLKSKRTRKKTLPMVRCHDGFCMSVQASRDHYCEPRDDQGPYTHVEVGYPNHLEELLLPFSDKATTMAGMRPTLYVRVPAHIINSVVTKHAGISSGRLPNLIDTDYGGVRGENGSLWAAACVPPSTSEESDEEEEGEENLAPTSVIHMGAPPPPPPPLPTPTPTQTSPETGRLSPPTPLRNITLSPIERSGENFE